MKETKVTFYQTIGHIDFSFEVEYLVGINASNYNKVGKLLFGGIEITLYYVDKRVTMRPECMIFDAAFMEFSESPLEWTCRHMNAEVCNWINDCLIKFDRAIDDLI